MYKIDPKPGEIWICRDGEKARIYAVDGRHDSPIHGAVRTDCGWDPLTWLKNGRVSEYGPNGFDLIQKYDWREELKPIWAVLKPEFRWVAMDKGGVWYVYDNKPRVESDEEYWDVASEFEGLHALSMPTPDCPWYKTLTKRPE